MRRCSGRCRRGWRGREGIQRQIEDRVAANLAELDRQLRAQEIDSAVWTWRAAGTRCCGFRPFDRTRLTVRELLDRGVWVHPGYFFGMPESGWLVVSLLAPEAEFSAGITGILDCLREQGER